MDYVCIALVVCNTVRGTFLVRGLHKLEFKTCLDSWSAWRLALDSVEQSQNSCVIIGLGQERYAEKTDYLYSTACFYFLHKHIIIKKNNAWL